MSDFSADGVDRPDTARFDLAPGFGASDAEATLSRLQRNGGALAACECGSRSWLPPNAVYQLVATGASSRVLAKAIVPVTCAACGFTKLYDPAVVASLAESSGRW